MMHRRIACALSLICGCASSLSWTPGSGGSSSSNSSSSGGDASAGHHGDSASAWKKFTLKDITLGSDFDKVAGFTCGPDPASDGYTTYRHTCVKFLDDRCAGRPSKIHHIRSSSDVPGGQSCFMDEGSGGTYLDRKFQSPPLSAISIVATDTRSPRVYEVNYTFAKDVLTDDSNLGKALVAKYGAPSSRNAPIGMGWTDGDVQLTASCGATVGPTGEYCTLSVSDTALLDLERSKQKVADDESARKNGPAAPKL